MTVKALLDRLDGVRSLGAGRWKACCAVHADISPSLSIREANGKLLLHCFAGCTPEEIVGALGKSLKDLFTDSPTPRGQQLTPKSQKFDLVDVAFRLEMAALDRRLRADAVLQAVENFSSDDLSDSQRDRLMNVAARAYADRGRAEFLESVADGFRWKAFEERRNPHAA